MGFKKKKNHLSLVLTSAHIIYRESRIEPLYVMDQKAKFSKGNKGKIRNVSL